jgi:hypothetical protein
VGVLWREGGRFSLCFKLEQATVINHSFGAIALSQENLHFGNWLPKMDSNHF